MYDCILDYLRNNSNYDVDTKLTWLRDFVHAIDECCNWVSGIEILDSSSDTLSFGKMYLVIDDATSSQYTITLPNPAGHENELIGFYGGTIIQLTRFVKIAPNGIESIGGLNFDCIHNKKVLILMSDGTNWQFITRENILISDEQLDLDSSMNINTINDWIKCLPQDLGGNILTVQLDNGAYNLGDSIEIKGFTNGVLRFYGNNADCSLSTSKKVSLNFDGEDCHGVIVDTSSAGVEIYYLKVEIDSDTTNGCFYFGVYR